MIVSNSPTVKNETNPVQTACKRAGVEVESLANECKGIELTTIIRGRNNMQQYKGQTSNEMTHKCQTAGNL